MLSGKEIAFAFELSKLSQFSYSDLSNGGSKEAAKTSENSARVAFDQKKIPRQLADRLFGVTPSGNVPIWRVDSPWYKSSASKGHSDPDSGFAGKLLTNTANGGKPLRSAQSRARNDE